VWVLWVLGVVGVVGVRVRVRVRLGGGFTGDFYGFA
jgi:hypothetical protein